MLPRRAVLFLISDFIDEDYLDVVRHANRKHDVVAVRVTDQREEKFESAGLMTLEDAETGQRRLVDTQSPAFREALEEQARERKENLERELRRSKIDVLTIDADPIHRRSVAARSSACGRRGPGDEEDCATSPCGPDRAAHPGPLSPGAARRKNAGPEVDRRPRHRRCPP